MVLHENPRRPRLGTTPVLPRNHRPQSSTNPKTRKPNHHLLRSRPGRRPTHQPTNPKNDRRRRPRNRQPLLQTRTLAPPFLRRRTRTINNPSRNRDPPSLRPTPHRLPRPGLQFQPATPDAISAKRLPIRRLHLPHIPRPASPHVLLCKKQPKPGTKLPTQSPLRLRQRRLPPPQTLPLANQLGPTHGNPRNHHAPRPRPHPPQLCPIPSHLLPRPATNILENSPHTLPPNQHATVVVTSPPRLSRPRRLPRTSLLPSHANPRQPQSRRRPQSPPNLRPPMPSSPHARSRPNPAERPVQTHVGAGAPACPTSKNRIPANIPSQLPNPAKQITIRYSKSANIP